MHIELSSRLTPRSLDRNALEPRKIWKPLLNSPSAPGAMRQQNPFAERQYIKHERHSSSLDQRKGYNTRWHPSKTGSPNMPFGLHATSPG